MHNTIRLKFFFMISLTPETWLKCKKTIYDHNLDNLINYFFYRFGEIFFTITFWGKTLNLFLILIGGRKFKI